MNEILGLLQPWAWMTVGYLTLMIGGLHLVFAPYLKGGRRHNVLVGAVLVLVGVALMLCGVYAP